MYYLRWSYSNLATESLQKTVKAQTAWYKDWYKWLDPDVGHYNIFSILYYYIISYIIYISDSGGSVVKNKVVAIVNSAYYLVVSWSLEGFCHCDPSFLLPL